MSKQYLCLFGSTAQQSSEIQVCYLRVDASNSRAGYEKDVDFACKITS